MRVQLYLGSEPVSLEIEENDYKPKLTLSNATHSISADLDSIEDLLEDMGVTLDEDTKEELRDEISELNSEVSGLRSDVSSLESGIEDKESEIEDLKDKIEELEEQIRELKTQAEMLSLK